MRNPISHILSGFFSPKTLLLGVLVFAVLFSPLHTAQANPLADALGWAIEHAVNPVLNIILGFIAGIFFGMFTAVAGTMNAIITFLMSINVAPGALGTPPFVNEAWGYSRNLVNIIFILILTFIGLATILRLQSYQMQKTLPSLIIIALLVNFSGVLVGFIADIGNLVTKVFLREALGNPSIWNINPWSGINFEASPLLQLVRILFYSLAILIFFIVMLLFAVRIMILWTLAILAPLAFGAYILPGTKKYWTQWLQTLIQWSIVGIPISFFLFFAQKAIQMGAVGTPGGLSAQVTGFFAPLTALVLLFVGITLSMQFAPAGAQGIIDRGKKWGTKAGGWAAREGWRKIGKKTEAGAGAVRKKGQDIAANAEERLKTAKFGSAQWVGSHLARFGGKALSVTGGGVEMGSQKGNLAVSKKDRESIAQAEKDIGENSDKAFDIIETEEATGALKGGMLKDTSKELGAFTKIIKNGDTDKIEARLKDGRMTWDFVRKMYKNSVDNGNTDQRRLIEKAFLSRALDKKDAQGNIITPNELGASAEHQEKIFEKIEGQDFKGVLGTESLDITTESGKMTMDEIIKHRGADLMPQFLRNANKEQRQAASQYLDDKGIQWFIDNGAEDVLKYSLSSGAASLGINPIGGITQNQLTDLVAIKKPTEQLKREMATTDIQLTDPTLNNNRRRNLDKRKNQIAAQLTLRAGFGPEDAKDDNAQIQAKRSEYNTTVQNLQALETATPAANRDEAYYRQEATLVKKRDEIASEFKRRGLKIEGVAATPLEDQPLSVQIARLKEQESRLAAQAKLPHLPGEKAREQRKKIQQKLKNLEERFYAAPPVLFDKEVELGRIEGEIIDNEEGIRKIEQEITTQQKLGATQQQIQQLEALKASQQQEIQRLNQEKAKAITSWQGARSQIQLLTPETAIAEDLAQALAEEKKYSNQLLRQRTAKETEEKLQATRDLSKHAGQTRQRAEQRLTGILHAQQLQRESRVAVGMKIPNFQTIVAQNQAEIQRIKQVEGDFDTTTITGGVTTLGRGLVHKPTSALTPQERQLIADYEKEIAKLKETEEIKKQISRLLKEEKKAHS